MASMRLHRLLSLPPAIRSLALGSDIQFIATARSPKAINHFSTSTRHRSAESHDTAPSPQSSVDQTELSHFNALASSWWDPHGSSRLLHLMNPLRHKFIRQCLNDPQQPTSRKLRYLDIGCGGGIFAESAARLSHTQSVTAIDPSPSVISVAKQHQRRDPFLLEPGRLNYENIAIEHLPPPETSRGGGFDILTLFEVIEHIPNPSTFLQTCLKHLRPGGWLIGSTIARTNVSWFTTKLMAEDVLRLVPRGTHDWNRYIQPYEMRKWAREQPELHPELDGWQVMGVVYVPGLGWKEVEGSEDWGNYFFGVRKKSVDE